MPSSLRVIKNRCFLMTSFDKHKVANLDIHVINSLMTYQMIRKIHIRPLYVL